IIGIGELKTDKFNYNDIDEMVSGSLNVINEENAKTWVQFGLKMDSLGENINFSVYGDSTFDLKELNAELEKAKLELKKLKKQKKEKKLP
nr:hypothetical protein [Melioribacteraceae bacterium]